jgi:hypothetical protein
VVRVKVSTANLGYNLRDSSWGVALNSELPIVSEQLVQLREVGICWKGLFDRLAVEDVGIRGQSNAVVCNTSAHVRHEVMGVLAGTLANKKRRNEFGVSVEGNKNPCVSKLSGVVLPNVADNDFAVGIAACPACRLAP